MWSVAQSCPTLWGPIECSPQAPLSMGFSKKEYWSGLPFPTPRNLPNPGIEASSLVCSALAGGFFTTSTTWIEQTVTPPAVAWIMPTWWWSGQRFCLATAGFRHWEDCQIQRRCSVQMWDQRRFFLPLRMMLVTLIYSLCTNWVPPLHQTLDKYWYALVFHKPFTTTKNITSHIKLFWKYQCNRERKWKTERKG